MLKSKRISNIEQGILNVEVLACLILRVNGQLMILRKATELRNICRNQLKRVQKVRSTETFFNHRFGTLCL